MTDSPTVLFLCTGNYFRSRFAELLFTRLAEERALPFRADSAGLARSCGTRNVGPISPHTLVGLQARGIPLPDVLRPPRDVTLEDLERAHLVIAVKEAEHRQMVEARFAPVAEKVRYWHVHDIDVAQPEEALAALEVLVRALVEELAA